MIPRPVFLAALCVALASTFTAHAEPETAEARRAEIKKLADGLDFQQGAIELRGGLAKVKVPAGFRYLGPVDTETVLTKIWGNPPGGARSLGMLFPAEVGPMDRDGWGVVITYEEDGYVKDDDATKINYDDLLKDMKKDTAEGSQAREKKGYPSIELVGWAARPHYDAAEKKMYWAKELRFGGETPSTLNYNIRMLGRRGVLVLNAIASMDQLAAVEKATPEILAMVNFQDGHRYADFNASTDKVATYGLAALVAGGLLAKGGFFKVLLVSLLAGKKFIIIGAIALFALGKKLLARFSPPKQRDLENV